MRLIIVSDTHGALDARVEALARTADLVVHAGDIGSAAVLQRLGAKVHAVRGNNDVSAKWVGPASVLAALPEACELSLPGGQLMVEHGHRVNPAPKRHALLRARYPNAALVVYGHSHRQIIDQEERPWVANPGAAGRSRTYGGPACLELLITSRQWFLRAHRYPLEG